MGFKKTLNRQPFNIIALPNSSSFWLYKINYFSSNYKFLRFLFSFIFPTLYTTSKGLKAKYMPPKSILYSTIPK